MSKHPARQKPVPLRPWRRGVILILALVFLAVLTVVGVAFVLFVAQERKASRNMLDLAQAELAADSAENHALALLRHAAFQYGNQNCHGAWTQAGWRALQGDGSPTAPEAGKPQRQDWPRYFSYDGKVNLFTAGFWPDVRHYEDEAASLLAREGELKTGDTTKEMEHSVKFGFGNIKGKYYVTLVDLDGKLYLPMTWWSGNDGDLPPRLDELAERQPLLRYVLQFAKDEGGAFIWCGGYEDETDKIAGNLAAATLKGNLTPENRQATDWSLGDITRAADLLVPGSPGGPEKNDPYINLYLKRKYYLGKYFTAYPHPQFIKNVNKDDGEHNYRPRLNANTANQLVLAANLLVVPGMDAAKAEALAARLVKCRPFFSRVDLEDFLAAQLKDELYKLIAKDPIGNTGKTLLELRKFDDEKVRRAMVYDGGVDGNWQANGFAGTPPAQTPLGSKKRLDYFRATSGGGLDWFDEKMFNTVLNATVGRCASFWNNKAVLVVWKQLAVGNSTYEWKHAGADQAKWEMADPTAADNRTGVYRFNFDNLDLGKLKTNPNYPPDGNQATTDTVHQELVSKGEVGDSEMKTKDVVCAQELKLRSRFFWLFVAGRVALRDWSAAGAPLVYPAAARRQLVLDVKTGKVLWRRDQACAKGQLSDPTPSSPAATGEVPF